MKHRLSHLLLLPFVTFVCPAQAANVDAGSVNYKPESNPYVSLEPQQNLTNVFNFGTPLNKQEPESNPDIYFAADELENDDELQIITAMGNVSIVRENLNLKADKVIYNQKDDIVTAVGNVVLVEQDGNVVFSDYVELTDKMTQGEMRNIKVVMKDQSKMSALRIRRLAKDNKVMDNAVYSPCDVCRGKEPLWQLKARKVKHYAETQDVRYNDATIEIKGVPVFYTPYLSHPDPTVKRRSGFLPPKVSSNSYLGATIQPKYFWNISDQEDLTFSPILTSDKGIVWGGLYNKYFYRGDLSVSGTYLKDGDDGRHRGNLFLTGRYEINDFWVADTDINYASDNTYLKDLSLPREDDSWLTSVARLQGFDNRNYASLEAYAYKLISYDLKDYEKPYVVPLMNYENISEPGAYGSYSKTTLNFASIYRENETSTQRATMINSWNLPYTSPYGEKYRLVASLKSDFYYVDDYLNSEGEDFSGTVARVFPQLGLEWRLPFVRATESSRQILEPVVVAVAAPNKGNKINKIPNEDSQDVELDDTNILDLDRYAGYDRNDSGSRISYGLNWSAYGQRTGRTSFFLAQSYKFDQDESFTNTSGDSDGHFTDYVGRAYAAPNEYLDLNYRFKLDKKNFDFSYSELSAEIGPKILSAYISYIYLKENEDSSLIDGSERKELYTVLRAALSKDWSIDIYNRQDLTHNGGSLEYGGNLIYEDECLKFITTLRRDNSNDPNYQGDFEVSFTFLLKTLGGASSS